MTSIHHKIFCHDNRGGAFLVASLRARCHNCPIITLSLTNIFDFLEDLRAPMAHTSEFHQPGSFPFAIVYALIKGGNSVQIWLHESATYSLRVKRPFSAFSWIARLTLVHLLYALGSHLIPVSRYVRRSYCLNGTRVNLASGAQIHCHLFKPKHFSDRELMQRIHNGVAIIFMRPYANCSVTLGKFVAAARCLGINRIIVLGPHVDLPSVASTGIPTTWLGIVERTEFLRLISSSFVFVTLFKREGLGLSALEAMSNANIVFSPRSGAYVDYIPKCNNDLLEYPNFPCLALGEQLLPTMRENIDVAKRFFS